METIERENREVARKILKFISKYYSVEEEFLKVEIASFREVTPKEGPFKVGDDYRVVFGNFFLARWFVYNCREKEDGTAVICEKSLKYLKLQSDLPVEKRFSSSGEKTAEELLKSIKDTTIRITENIFGDVFREMTAKKNEQIEALRDELRKRDERIEKLRQKKREIKYQPGGIVFQRIKKEFEERAQ